jgi:hypothetical protein
MTIQGLLGFQFPDFVLGVWTKETLALSWLLPMRVAVVPTQVVSLKIRNHEKANITSRQRFRNCIAIFCSRLRTR